MTLQRLQDVLASSSGMVTASCRGRAHPPWREDVADFVRRLMHATSG